jgi:hypothetical protein
MDKALSFVKDNPEGFVALTLSRIKEFWLGDPLAANEWNGNLRLSYTVSWMKKVCILLPIPFMLLGILQVLRKRNLNGLPLLAYLSFTPLVYYITHVSERYRFPMEPVMLVFACYGFCALIEWVRDHVPVSFDRINPRQGRRQAGSTGCMILKCGNK